MSELSEGLLKSVAFDVFTSPGALASSLRAKQTPSYPTMPSGWLAKWEQSLPEADATLMPHLQHLAPYSTIYYCLCPFVFFKNSILFMCVHAHVCLSVCWCVRLYIPGAGRGICEFPGHRLPVPVRPGWAL